MQQHPFPTHPGYQAALDYLYSFINYENKMPPSPDHARFNLDRMRWLLAQLGSPHDRYPAIVVAGTKGKGSTAAMIESMLRAGGYRTGLFSSPHLHSWRERVQVNRVLIEQAQVVRLIEMLKPLVERLPTSFERPTTFELATALALSYFAERQVDVAVLEVGLGGRYDTVNVVTPVVAAITPISFDHVAVLGPTLRDIARAKAGIVKPGVPVVVAPQADEALGEILREAGDASPVWAADASSLRPLVNAADLPRAYPVPVDAALLSLKGQYQLENARTAMGVAVLLRDHGFELPARVIADALRTVSWPARFEVVPGTPAVVIDGAMNGASAARLREGLAALPHRRLILVLGTSRDKDIGAIARELVPAASAVVVTRSRHPRSAEQEVVAEVIKPLLQGPLVITDDVPPAIDEARRLATKDDLICVAGSLFVAAAAREALGLAREID